MQLAFLNHYPEPLTDFRSSSDVDVPTIGVDSLFERFCNGSFDPLWPNVMMRIVKMVLGWVPNHQQGETSSILDVFGKP